MSTETEDWESIELTDDTDVVVVDEMDEEKEAGHTDTSLGCFAVFDDE